MAPRAEEKAAAPVKTELKCRACGKIKPVGDFTYSQKKKKHLRRCPQCVAVALYLRGEGPKPAGFNGQQAAGDRIELTNQLLPPQKLSGVSYLNAVVVEAGPSGPGPRRPRAAESHKQIAEKDVTEETLGSNDGFKKPAAKPASSEKSGHQRKPSADDQRALYKRQVAGRAAIRASREFTEEEKGELLKGPQGRKRLSVVEGGYLRPSMKPGRPRIVGGK